MKLSSREKLIVCINYLIGFVIALKYTVLIDFANVQPHQTDWLMLVFLLFFTAALLGTPLFCLAVILNPKRSKHFTDEELFVYKSCFNAIGIATAYTMLLYFFGLTNSFFSFVVFYQ